MIKLLIGLMFVFSMGVSFAYNYGSTHSVEGYTKSDGTYVEQHEAGNPGSGVHCHDDVCE